MGFSSRSYRKDKGVVCALVAADRTRNIQRDRETERKRRRRRNKKREKDARRHRDDYALGVIPTVVWALRVPCPAADSTIPTSSLPVALL